MIPLDTLFEPESVILVGAAHTETKLGGAILKNLLRFPGQIYPVNPKYHELMGRKAFSRVQDVPGTADLAIIMRPAPEVPEILRDLKGRTRCVVVMSSGFAEVGEVALQEEVRRFAREENVRILGPNCMGIYNPYRKLDTFFLTQERLKRPGRGNVAIVSQSGAILSCLMSAVRDARAGVSKAVGYGNAADIDEAELFEFLSEDRRTGVVVAYIESTADGRRFVERAGFLSGKKPLVVLKAGKADKGQAAAFSHTGRLAGRYEVFRSILRQFRIREAQDFDELMDATQALSFQGAFRGPERAGRRVLIITNGGGSGVLAADECVRQGLEVERLPAAKREKLIEAFPHFYGVNNPVDLTAQVVDRDYLTALETLAEDYDGFLLIALPNVLGITEGLAVLLRDFRARVNKPLVVHLAHSGISLRLTSLLARARIPVYPSPERAVRGLRALLD